MNGWYDRGLYSFARGEIDWLAADIRVLLVGSGYVVDRANDAYLDWIDPANRIAVTAALTGKNVVDAGELRAADTLFPAPAAGQTGTGMVVYHHTGDETTSTLLAWFDTRANGEPISITTDGLDVPLDWAGVGGLLRL